MAFRDDPCCLHPRVCVKGWSQTAHGEVGSDSLHSELRLMACVSLGWSLRS